MQLQLSAPAKLNLFLHITGQREDGYHELQTLFRLLDYGDTLGFTANRSGEIRLSGSPADIPPQDNLVVRAARLLQRDDFGVDIHLDKRIPAGGGLGGGSSDAATTLLGLNHLWQLGLSSEQLQAIGAQLGADIPVFVAGHTAWAEGIGERLTAVELPEAWYLIMAPDCHVSTAQIFSHRQLTRNTGAITIAAFFEGHTRNDCQSLVRELHPEVDNALNWLGNFGDARLTGTGACVFCEFPGEAQARAVLARLPQGAKGFVARGLNASPVIRELSSYKH
ncbi:4-(cytidine 5'-diphospho)-2-C-methyl-D-erythritol kinase [Mangrovimicrobium sediminis]|uniref:4-diphosphocytidyl-2-C-methyl-D-erythritol kinase n=1 Tax=Mangrovimicrobium sediminis TaxID=2562682 RepID=A0A4Z0LWJ3_9GAMM|nr:4-(cytidine 5'-diphospho)-2-C-methyl-D-erythritol kinase [Haliea sp. SAOS-164]TGD71536.1 4-(cytidine 5'-diphospho)-2-C-methyl-D-erythritol kinase [Haliea sp. SAOS-164]